MSERWHGFSIPLLWTSDWVKSVISLDSHIRVTDFYGTLETEPFRSGRIKYVRKHTTNEDPMGVVKTIHQLGRKFKYLLNAPMRFSGSLSPKQQHFLEWLRDGLQVDALVISSPELMKHCQQIVPELPVHISTIAGIRTPEELRPMLRFRPTLLVPHHDVPRNPKMLKSLQIFCNDNGLILELMVTESCLFQCDRREEHYLTISDGLGDSDFHAFCRQMRQKEPAELFAAASFIRPEDINLYVNHFQIHQFKITGRSRPEQHLLECCQAYFNERSPDNLVRLMGMDPRVQGEHWIRMSPLALQGMLEEILVNQKPNRETSLFWCKKALTEGLFEISPDQLAIHESIVYKES